MKLVYETYVKGKVIEQNLIEFKNFKDENKGFRNLVRKTLIDTAEIQIQEALNKLGWYKDRTFGIGEKAGEAAVDVVLNIPDVTNHKDMTIIEAARVWIERMKIVDKTHVLLQHCTTDDLLQEIQRRITITK